MCDSQSSSMNFSNSWMSVKRNPNVSPSMSTAAKLNGSQVMFAARINVECFNSDKKFSIFSSVISNSSLSIIFLKLSCLINAFFKIITSFIIKIKKTIL